MRKTYGPRFDPDGVQHARVSQATAYRRITTLWERKIAGGKVRCELLGGADGPARRIVQLIADYPDGDGNATIVRMCKSLEEETSAMLYIERTIIAASRRGSTAEAAADSLPSAP